MWLKYWKIKYQSIDGEEFKIKDKFCHIIENVEKIFQIQRHSQYVSKLCMAFLFYVDMINTTLGSEDDIYGMDKKFSKLDLNQKLENNVAERSTESIMERAINFFRDISTENGLKRQKELSIILNPINQNIEGNPLYGSRKGPLKRIQFSELDIALWSYLEPWILEFTGHLRVNDKKLHEKINDSESMRKIMNSIFIFSIHYLTKMLQSSKIPQKQADLSHLKFNS